jgi:hypothetical protein
VLPVLASEKKLVKTIFTKCVLDAKVDSMEKPISPPWEDCGRFATFRMVSFTVPETEVFACPAPPLKEPPLLEPPLEEAPLLEAPLLVLRLPLESNVLGVPGFAFQVSKLLHYHLQDDELSFVETYYSGDFAPFL